MELRDYQLDGIDDLRDVLREGFKRVVMMAPTGAGKTVIAAAIIKMAREKGKRIVFCVPAITLIDQTVARFRASGITGIGVIQADHPLTNPFMPIQVCSVQTLGRRGYEQLKDSHLVIFDEVHVQFKLYKKWMDDPEWANIPFIGLSATPWAKGMGKLWQKLIIVRTIGQLIEEGFLSDFRVYASSHPDLSGVKTVQTIYGADYDQTQLGERMGGPKLVADVVSTWLEKAEGRPTILFAVNCLHAQALCEQFRSAGVKAAYVDAYTERERRTQIEQEFNAGLIDVVCNVGVLTTGVDWDVRCIQLVRPTKSEMLYVQMIGRGLRIADGKDYCLILDHSDTTLRLGFVTEIHHDELNDGKKPVQIKSKPLPKECPQCHALRPIGVRICPACGFEVEPKNTVLHAHGDLHEIGRKGKQVKVITQEEKEKFYRELIRFGELKGYNPGWVYHAYREKFGVGPSQYFNRTPAPMVSPGTASWLKHRAIAMAKAREKVLELSNGQRGVGEEVAKAPESIR